MTEAIFTSFTDPALTTTELVFGGDPSHTGVFTLVGAAPRTSSTLLAYMDFGPGSEVPAHTHSAEETIVVLEGSIEVLVGDERTLLTAGGVGFVPAGVTHSYVSAEGVRFVEFFPASVIVSLSDASTVSAGGHTGRVLMTPLATDLEQELSAA